MTDNKQIPLYTKVGFRLTVLMALFLAVMILKNCATAIHYGVTTDEQTIRQYYHAGYGEGVRQARLATTTHQKREEPAIDNPLIRKAKSRGFRDGWDTEQGRIKTSRTGQHWRRDEELTPIAASPQRPPSSR